MIGTQRRCPRAFVCAWLVVSLICAPLMAAEETADPQSSGSDAQERLSTRITYSCAEKPIDSVLLDLANEVGIDIIKSPKVTGNVTVKVTDVPLGEALTNILAAYDYTYVATENMIRVTPLSEIAMAKEQLVSKVYRITYADANEVASALAGFVSEKGRVALNRGTSHIVVTDLPDKIKAVDRFVLELDRETPQVLVEVRVYDITTREGFELGKQWHVNRNEPLKTSQHTNTSIDSDAPEQVTKTEVTATDGTVVENETINYSPDFTTDPQGWRPTLRETLTTTTGPTTETVTETEDTEKITYENVEQQTYTTRRRKPFVGGSFDTIRGGTLSFSILNDAVDLEFALNVLKTQVEAKLLANPRILVLDNETARFDIVREVPYREIWQVAREDPITYTDFKNVGVQLEVTPHVTRDGKLRLHVKPEFGVLVSQDPNGVPTIDTRRADTKALIRDGQTIAIGGLRKKQTSKDVSKVPVLGDIPLLGGLFRSTSEIEENNELVVFITTKIINQPEMLATQPTDVIETPNLLKLDEDRPGHRAEEQTAEPPAEREEQSPPMETTERRPLTEAESHQDKPQPQADTPERRVADQPTHDMRETAIDRSNPEAMVHMAYAYIKSERYEQAAELLSSVIAIQPDSAIAHRYLAYCLLRLRRTDSAVKNYRKAIELSPDDWEAHRGLGVAYMLQAKESGDTDLQDKAVEHWQRSLSLNTDQPNGDQLRKLVQAYSQ